MLKLGWSFFNMRKRNKKAQIEQIMFIMVTLVGFVLAALIGKTILTQVESGFADSDIGTNETQKVFDDFKVAWPTFDYMILFILVGLTIALIITSFLIPTHPVFLVINIIGMFGLIWGGAALSNMYYELTASDGTNPVFNSIVEDGQNDFAKMTFIMKYLPWISLIIVFISSMIMFSKGSRGDGGGGEY